MARPPIDAPRRRTRPTGTPVEAAVVPALLPDEDPADFQALHAALRAELAPRTPYQTRLADNLVELEWEMRRHRRLIAGALRRGFRAQAAAVAIRGTPGTLTRVSIDPEEREAMQWAAALTMIPPEHANEIEQVLEERGVTRSEIVAAAYAADPVIAIHEARIADLERRRRHLLQDYRALRALPPPNVPDAEVLG